VQATLAACPRDHHYHDFWIHQVLTRGSDRGDLPWRSMAISPRFCPGWRAILWIGDRGTEIAGTLALQAMKPQKFVLQYGFK
jgi:hypothetical protein